ncbi:major facilitator superfamily protein, putative, partial [Ichthyophthirius multifiliis]
MEQSILGSFYSWGGYSIYLSSYLKSNDHNIQSDLVSLIFPFMNIVMNALIPFGERIIAKAGLKNVVFVGIAFLSTFFQLLSIIKNFYLIAFIYIFCIAPIYGILYMVPFLCSWRYFPTKPGEVNAILQAGYGFGSAIFSYFSYIIVNYQNDQPKRNEYENGENSVYFEECISYNTPSMMTFFAVSFVILGTFSLIFLKNNNAGLLQSYHYYQVVKQKNQN